MDLQTRLTEKLNNLLEQLNELPFDDDESYDKILARIRDAEKRLAKANIADIIERANKTNEAKRLVMRDVLALPQPSIDWFTNDMKLHKGKKKQCPEWWDFQEKYNAYFGIEYGIIHVRLARDKYDWGYNEYNSSDNSKTLRPFTSFSHACEHNDIIPEPLVFDDVITRLAALEEANQVLKDDIIQYEKTRNNLNYSQLQGVGLVSQNPTHLYTYETKFKI